MSAVSEKPAQVSPYRGIQPFRYVDRDYYIGREETIEELLAKVLLYRLVLLFGESGAGKSSLLNAGLVGKLRQKNFQPEKLRVRPIPGQPILVERIKSDTLNDHSFLPSIFVEDESEDAPAVACSLETFSRMLEAKLSEDIYPVLIFDQFEELFTLFSPITPAEQELQLKLLQTIIKIVSNPLLKVKVIIAIREDFMGKLEVIAKNYPQVFDNRIRLGLLNEADAGRAVLEPFKGPNPFQSRLTPELASVIVKQLESTPPDILIQPTHLQIVCSGLWERYAGMKREIGVEEFKEMGEVKGILDDFLTSELAQVGASQHFPPVMILNKLVTESGTRDVVSLEKLTESIEHDDTEAKGYFKNLFRSLVPQSAKEKEQEKQQLLSTLETLESRRLVNKVAQRGTYYYEISSEFLIEPVQKERARYFVARERKKKNLFRRAAIWSATLAALIIAGLLVMQHVTAQRADAEEKQKTDEFEVTKDYRDLITALADSVSEDESKRRIAIDKMKQLAKQNKVPEALIPLIKEVLAKRDPQAATVIAKTVEIAAKSNPTPATAADSTSQTRVFIQIADDSQRPQAQQIQKALQGRGMYAPGIEKVDKGPDANEVRYFHKGEEDKVDDLVAILKSLGLSNLRKQYIRGYENSTLIKPNQFELWFAGTSKPATSTSDAQQATQTATPEKPQTATVLNLKGRATAYGGNAGAIELKVGMTLNEGDMITVEEGAEIQLQCSNGFASSSKGPSKIQVRCRKK